MGPSERLRVAWVDDDPDVLRHLKRAIDREPEFDLVAATTESSEAIDLISHHRPDVLVVDHVMPARHWRTVAHGGSPARYRLALILAARILIPHATVAVLTRRERP